MKKIELKIWPEYLDAIVDGRKPFELRRNDRDYQVGDILVLKAWNPAAQLFTGAVVEVEVTYVLQDTGWLQPDIAALGIRYLKSYLLTDVDLGQAE